MSRPNQKSMLGQLLTRNALGHLRTEDPALLSTFDRNLTPDAFVRLEIGRKPRRKPISLAPVWVTK